MNESVPYEDEGKSAALREEIFRRESELGNEWEPIKPYIISRTNGEGQSVEWEIIGQSTQRQEFLTWCSAGGGLKKFEMPATQFAEYLRRDVDGKGDIVLDMLKNIPQDEDTMHRELQKMKSALVDERVSRNEAWKEVAKVQWNLDEQQRRYRRKWWYSIVAAGFMGVAAGAGVVGVALSDSRQRNGKADDGVSGMSKDPTPARVDPAPSRSTGPEKSPMAKQFVPNTDLTEETVVHLEDGLTWEDLDNDGIVRGPRNRVLLMKDTKRPILHLEAFGSPTIRKDGDTVLVTQSFGSYDEVKVQFVRVLLKERAIERVTMPHTDAHTARVRKETPIAAFDPERLQRLQWAKPKDAVSADTVPVVQYIDMRAEDLRDAGISIRSMPGLFSLSYDGKNYVFPVRGSEGVTIRKHEDGFVSVQARTSTDSESSKWVMHVYNAAKNRSGIVTRSMEFPVEVKNPLDPQPIDPIGQNKSIGGYPPVAPMKIQMLPSELDDVLEDLDMRFNLRFDVTEYEEKIRAERRLKLLEAFERVSPLPKDFREEPEPIELRFGEGLEKKIQR